MSTTRLFATAICGCLVVANLAAGNLSAEDLIKVADDKGRVISGPAQLELVAPPSAESVRTRVLEWVAQRPGVDKSRLDEIGRLWGFGETIPTAAELFERTIRSFCLADSRTAGFVEACHLRGAPLLPPEAALLTQEGETPFYAANLGLYYGRYLSHRQMYEEALRVLDKVSIPDVVDPASVFFFRAVSQHHLLMKDEGLKTIEQLLKNTEDVPVRYSTIATLMQFDLEALQEKSLDEVARKMSDVGRRLELGRAGQGVQKKEEEIIATLDEIIKKIEDQQGGGGGGGGQGGNTNRPGSPAQDSVIKGSTAPGKVDPKKLTAKSEWGDLPAKARAKAMDLISREFPAHYRTAIEEYTRKGANRSADSGK
jgi:hypothetical protein